MRSNIPTNAKKNFVYNSVYQLVAIAIPLITTPYVARVLGAESIGLYSYSHAIAYYFVMFIMLGLNNYGNRTIAFVRDDKKKLSTTFFEIYRMQLSVAAIAILCYCGFATLWINTTMSWIMLIYVISAALDINWFFFGLEQFKTTALRSSIVKVITTISIFIFVKNPDDIIIYSLINVLGLLASQLILWSRVRKYIDYVRSPLKNSLKHLKPNLVLFIPVIAISLYKMMDKVMLGSLSNLEQVGFYENTEKIIQVPLALATSLGTIMLPKISNLAAKNDHAKTRKYMEKSLYFATFLASSMCFGIMAVAKDFVPWYYGENYAPCMQLFQILMPSCLFLATANVIRTQYLIPYRQDKIYIASVIAGAFVNLVINALLIPEFGATGAAIGTLAAETCVCILQIALTWNKLKLTPTLVKSSIYIVIGIIMYLFISILPILSINSTINLLLKVLLGGILYLFLALPSLRHFNLLPPNLKKLKTKLTRPSHH